jgi:hypothetical protein
VSLRLAVRGFKASKAPDLSPARRRCLMTPSAGHRRPGVLDVHQLLAINLPGLTATGG